MNYRFIIFTLGAMFLFAFVGLPTGVVHAGGGSGNSCDSNGQAANAEECQTTTTTTGGGTGVTGSGGIGKTADALGLSTQEYKDQLAEAGVESAYGTQKPEIETFTAPLLEAASTNTEELTPLSNGLAIGNIFNSYPGSEHVVRGQVLRALRDEGILIEGLGHHSQGEFIDMFMPYLINAEPSNGETKPNKLGRENCNALDEAKYEPTVPENPMTLEEFSDFYNGPWTITYRDWEHSTARTWFTNGCWLHGSGWDPYQGDASNDHIHFGVEGEDLGALANKLNHPYELYLAGEFVFVDQILGE